MDKTIHFPDNRECEQKGVKQISYDDLEVTCENCLSNLHLEYEEIIPKNLDRFDF